MPDNDIEININTTASGDGVSRASAEIDNLTRSSDMAGEASDDLRNGISEIDDISDDARRELEGIVDQLDELRRRAEESSERARELADDTDLVADSSERFNTAQEGANRTLGEFPQVTGRAASGNRNLGLAAQEAVSGMNNLRGGVGNVLESITNLLPTLVGSAGMGAALAVVSVAAAKLIPLLLEQNDNIALNAQVAADAAEKRRAAAELERRAQFENSQELDRYTLLLNNEVDQVERSITAIDRLAAARGRDFAAKQAIADAELGLEISLIRNDSTLTDLEQTLRVAQLTQQAALDEQVRAEAEAVARIQDERAKLEASDETLNNVISQSFADTNELQRELDQKLRETDELRDSIEAIRTNLTEVSIPNLDRVINAEAGAQAVSTLGFRGTTFAPDREDFDSDQAFLNRISELREDDSNDLNNLPRTEGVIESINRQQESISGGESVIQETEAQIEILRQKIAEQERVRDLANETRNAEFDAATENIETLQQQIDLQARLNEISNQQAIVESGASIQQSAENQIPQQVSDFADAAVNELENEGATADVINAARQQINAVTQETRDALADGLLDQSEQTQIAQQISEISQAFSLSNQSIINNQNLLLNSIRALTRQQEIQAEQIRATANNIQSR